MLGAIRSNGQVVFYLPGKEGTHSRFGGLLNGGGDASQQDLFTPTQTAEVLGDIENDPLLKMALKLMGRPLDVEEKPVIKNNETGEQRVVRERNAFDIRRNGHNW